MIFMINAITIITAIIADKIAPSKDTISPEIDKPFTVFDFIKSNINSPIPSTENSADKISQSAGK